MVSRLKDARFGLGVDIGSRNLSMTDDILMIKRYHEKTKHHLYRFANSLGYLDWGNQPSPFRRYLETKLTVLPLSKEDHSPLYEDIFVERKIKPRPLTKETIANFLEYSLAISAWKQSGQARWALRINPSSGNLHPTEGYVILPVVEGICGHSGVYHYAPKEHGLEKRAEFTDKVWPLLPPNIFLVALTSLTWRETWKYGERAFRYCQHDCGHAYMALAVAARILGWTIQMIPNISDTHLAQSLGLDRQREFIAEEPEIPELLGVIFLESQEAKPLYNLPEEFIQNIVDGQWFGRANQLSIDHHPWDIIQEAEIATLKPETNSEIFVCQRTQRLRLKPSGHSSHQVIKKRRSAVDMDGATVISKEEFYQIVASVLDPFDGIYWPAKIHLGLFVHRVTGIKSGLYILVRDMDKLDLLKQYMHSDFIWEKPAGCPAGLPLYFLEEGDFRETAKAVSCMQDIASDGCFSLGMIAEFDDPLEQYGAWFYKRLFWETGMIGQMLYLEAEAADIQATGIGCFFDDPVHEIFGFQGTKFQSLYHFTVGGAVIDYRLTTLPAYERS